MDRVLRETVAWAEAETARGRGGVMVLLMGDHGQTVNGDHGGAEGGNACSNLGAE